MNIFNQFSYVLFSLVAIFGAAFLLWRAHVRTSIIAASAVILGIAAAIGWAVLRPGVQDVDNVEAAEAVIQSKNPTLVEFFSNYCVGCMAVRGTVDELVRQVEAEYGDRVNVLRVDIHTPSGRSLRERYGFSYTPEFVIFRGEGIEIWRSHMPPTLEELESIIANGGGAISG